MFDSDVCSDYEIRGVYLATFNLYEQAQIQPHLSDPRGPSLSDLDSSPHFAKISELPNQCETRECQVGAKYELEIKSLGFIENWTSSGLVPC